MRSLARLLLVVAALVAVALAGCRTRPYPERVVTDLAAVDEDAATGPLDATAPVDEAAPSDGAAILDQAAPRDAAAGDAAPGRCAAMTCDPSTQLCVFVDRGDCSEWKCVPAPSACLPMPTCGCLGAHFCDPLAQGSETLTCKASDPFVMQNGAVVTCDSPIKCI